MDEEIKLKLKYIEDKINHEIDGECHSCMSRFNCEWYYHLSMNFIFSNLHVDITISEETMLTSSIEDIISHCIECIKAEIISHYFK